MNSNPVKVALLGIGLIGADLLVKIHRSKWMQCTLVAGRNRETVGMQRAASLGYPITDGGIDALVEQPQQLYDLVFDATDAVSHIRHWQLLQTLGKKVIDLTPSGIGHMVVPSINAEDSMAHANINLVSCGGQAAIPILTALSRHVVGIHYIEAVTTASSLSIGRSTRLNLDEYIQTTECGIQVFTGVQAVKALVNISPARPPANFRVAMSVLAPGVDPEAANAIVHRAIEVARSYIPGYRLLTCAVLNRERVFVTVEIQGRGDLLPTYAGNLDIMNAAAVTIAEQYAIARLRCSGPPALQKSIYE